MGKRPAIALDLDGTVRRCCGCDMPPSPPYELTRVLSRIARGHYIALITGQPEVNVRLTQQQLGCDCQLLAPDYGATVITGDGVRETLASPQALIELQIVLPGMNEIARHFDGEPDARTAVGMKTWFFPTPKQFEKAERALKKQLVDSTGNERLVLKANRSDRSINLVDGSVTKGRVIEWLEAHGHPLLLAAGDSGADRPMLERAVFPVLTYCRTANGPDQTLAEMVRAQGGYVAVRADGEGLLDGFEAAKKAGVLRY